MDCIFCKIANHEIGSKIVYEDENLVAFEDINPKAKVHILIIPKIHIESINDINDQNKDLIANILNTIKMVAKKAGIYESGYRVISNIGEDGNQEVKHLHFHMLGGEKLNNF